jgi:drug/metabolite transporter (DMT)-like permease
VALAFAAVYLIWGSTYLGIAFALEAFPPFILGGLRFVLAGSALYVWARWQGAPRPQLIHWRSAVALGVLFFVCGNGSVSWAEQTVPSGLTAVLVAVVPIWAVLLEWLKPGGERPSGGTMTGMVLGFGGVALMMLPGQALTSHPIGLAGPLVLVVASLLWACGTLYSRSAPLPASTPLVAAMEMLCGGIALLLLAVVTGEWRDFAPQAITPKAGLAFLYLFTFGSLIGFTAFAYLAKVTTPVKVSTYAFVNPMVAVFLGWLLAGERLSARTLMASLAIVAAVVVIVVSRGARGRLPARQQKPDEIPAITDEIPAV